MGRALVVRFCAGIILIAYPACAVMYGDTATPPPRCGGVSLNPPAIAVDPSSDLAGIRYVFANHIGPPFTIPSIKNIVNSYQPVGKALGGTPGGQAMNFTVALRLGADGTCGGIFMTGYFNTIGEKGLLTWSSLFDITKPTWNNHKILYLDKSQKLEVWYQCYVANATTGLCDVPYFEVTIPTNPNLLSASARATLVQTVDKVLAPYCLSMADFLVTVHDDSLPGCGTLTQPADFVQAIALFAGIGKD
ncbi:hypothetical protein BV898_03478 [Hypsibius exemplaris]|uniref:Uncharacterized protein n=1 Tax=Hypsibius exemplaris TaxID=2072580 RepID=A0A1W0X596_HYPEX|nr:hypothetical protein BV898_03478 [Hypsibius exemplaris]